jgi:hypothetical protein
MPVAHYRTALIYLGVESWLRCDTNRPNTRFPLLDQPFVSRLGLVVVDLVDVA